MSDCSVDSNDLPPMPPLMKSKRTKLNRTFREHGPSSIPPSPASNLLEENMEKASCVRSASLENREDTSSIPPEYTSSTIPVSPPPLIKWTIPSASISNRQPAFEKAFQTADKSQRDEATSSTQSEMEDVVNWTSTFSGYEKHASPVKLPLQFEMDGLTPATASNTGVFGGRTPDLWEQADAFGMSVERRRPIGQQSYSSTVVAKKQDPYKRSKCKTLQRCQVCQKEFKYASRLRVHERIHTGDRPFKCDVCGMSFSHSCTLCVHKRTHTGERPHKCKTCGTSFTHSTTLRRHERIHSGERPFTCKTCARSFTQSSHLRNHERIHTGERPHRCRECSKVFRTSACLRRHERIHNRN